MNKGPKALRYRATQIYSSRVRVCNYSALVPGDCAPAAGDRAPAVLRRRRVPDLGQRFVPSSGIGAEVGQRRRCSPVERSSRARQVT